MHNQSREEKMAAIKNIAWNAAYAGIIIEELWVPIRKAYRLVYNVDLAMWPSSDFAVPEFDETGKPLTDAEGNAILCPAMKFNFARSVTYNVDQTDEGNFIYQKLTRKKGVRGDIKAHQNDATKVRVTYVTREEYEKFVSEEAGSPKEMSSQTILIRKMPVLDEETISAITDAAINEFIALVMDFALGFEFEDGRTPEVVNHRCAAV